MTSVAHTACIDTTQWESERKWIMSYELEMVGNPRPRSCLFGINGWHYAMTLVKSAKTGCCNRNEKCKDTMLQQKKLWSGERGRELQSIQSIVLKQECIFFWSQMLHHKINEVKAYWLVKGLWSFNQPAASSLLQPHHSPRQVTLHLSSFLILVYSNGGTRTAWEKGIHWIQSGQFTHAIMTHLPMGRFRGMWLVQSMRCTKLQRREFHAIRLVR